MLIALIAVSVILIYAANLAQYVIDFAEFIMAVSGIPPMQIGGSGASMAIQVGLDMFIALVIIVVILWIASSLREEEEGG